MYMSAVGRARGACIKTVQVALSFPCGCGNPIVRDAGRVAIFPGAWNPPTVAHLEVVRAARNWAGQVLLVLPKAFPHKTFEGAGFSERLELLCGLTESEPGTFVAVAEGGLYLEMAEETLRCCGPETEVGLVCGRDAAERIAAWDYGRAGVFEEMIGRHPLLVAARAGDYVPAAAYAERIVRLAMPAWFSEVSSTEVRRRIAAGEDWQALVPAAIADKVEQFYGKAGKNG